MTDDVTVLLVDDEHPARFGMQRALSREAGLRILEADGGQAALDTIAAEQPDLMLLDINMPDLDGMRVLEQVAEMKAAPLVVMVTAYNETATIVEAIKRGAHNYLTKPYEVDELRHVVRHAADRIRLVRDNARLQQELSQARTGYGEMLGRSDPMRKVFDQLDKVSNVNVSMLVTGESGTGKELVAREIHRRGTRARGPFVSVNCAALPDALIESELFGHEEGAFTGATSRQKGKMELADGGILFLDEIGDMSLGTQAKVLRALEEREFRRLGGHQVHQVDVQVVSATNRDLEAMIEEGSFRRDLYYRIKVVEIQLPALRDRASDIPQLAAAFVGQLSSRHGREISGLTPEAIRLLTAYPWPGNVRQLRNALEQAVVLADGPELDVDDLPAELAGGGSMSLTNLGEVDLELPFKEAKKRFVQAFERAIIEQRLRANGGNVTRTAEALAMHRQSLQHKLRELGINPRSFQES